MATVTCHSQDCGNADQGIDIDLNVYDDQGNPTGDTMPVSCGVCGQPITDIQ